MKIMRKVLIDRINALKSQLKELKHPIQAHRHILVERAFNAARKGDKIEKLQRLLSRFK